MRALTDEAFWQEHWRAQPSLVRRVGRGYPLGDALARATRAGARTFVELGGFPGYFSVYCRKHLGLEPTLVDFVADREAVQALLAANGLDSDAVRVVEGDVFEWEPEERFDVVFSSGLVEHFDDPGPVLARHASLLADGGTALVAVPNLHGVAGRLRRRLDPVGLESHNAAATEPRRLREELLRVGFDRVSVRYSGGFDVSRRGLDRQGLPTKAAVYGLKALARVARRLPIDSRTTSPYVVAEAR